MASNHEDSLHFRWSLSSGSQMEFRSVTMSASSSWWYASASHIQVHWLLFCSGLNDVLLRSGQFHSFRCVSLFQIILKIVHTSFQHTTHPYNWSAMLIMCSFTYTTCTFCALLLICFNVCVNMYTWYLCWVSCPASSAWRSPSTGVVDGKRAVRMRDPAVQNPSNGHRRSKQCTSGAVICTLL